MLRSIGAAPPSLVGMVEGHRNGQNHLNPARSTAEGGRGRQTHWSPTNFLALWPTRSSITPEIQQAQPLPLPGQAPGTSLSALALSARLGSESLRENRR